MQAIHLVLERMQELQLEISTRTITAATAPSSIGHVYIDQHKSSMICEDNPACMRPATLTALQKDEDAVVACLSL